MVAKKGKKSGKKVGSLAVKSMSAGKARGVKGGSFSFGGKPINQEKWIESAPSFGAKVTR